MMAVKLSRPLLHEMLLFGLVYDHMVVHVRRGIFGKLIRPIRINGVSGQGKRVILL